GTLAFMWETRYPLIPTEYASTLPALQEDYQEVWATLRRWFPR
ncbi:MAG: homogentisate 1,2-dioxygenase, partial [Actinobacteria bacterium]|nr:homogentisate 1,2-dioxygenase [Actinomycetota bacterium]NIS35025.1 homogentisate 1,2-dioxygenase [Actinomycetota bacterium]NIU21856.1 homogentisate 1,2-dioxygenase [Actinomycetota bacterium]NIU69750.1 homogentisate 1,2-dioxygenase [Actinomycetota bacterium]